MTNALFELLRTRIERPLVLIDVGAAGGVIDGWRSFGDRAQIFCFEAREEEADQLADANQNGNVEYVPIALAGNDRGLRLIITDNLGCSSSYSPNAKLVRYYPGCARMRPIKTVDCPSISLDAFIANRGISAVHAIKLDTQGSELDILKSGIVSLQHCQLILAETEFNPTYDGQPLFSDLDQFLRKQGFVLWRFNNLAHYSTGLIRADQHRMMIGSDPGVTNEYPVDNGQLFWADAIYVKAAATALSDESLEPADAIAAAALAARLNLWDLALEAIRKTADSNLLTEALRLLNSNFVQDFPRRLVPNQFNYRSAGVVGDQAQVDLSNAGHCLVWGPYLRLPEGRFRVTFDFSVPVGVDPGALLVFDVAHDEGRIDAIEIDGADIAVGAQSVSLDFDNRAPLGRFEFRVWNLGAASNVMMQYGGVSLSLSA